MGEFPIQGPVRSVRHPPGERSAPVSGSIALGIMALVALAGCAHEVANREWQPGDKNGGYRFKNDHGGYKDSDEVYVILAFSGGGTRASAFSFGALEQLRDTTYSLHGEQRSLLDDVAMISSVSGGSFTSAYYGLHSRDDFFRTFPDRFLYKNVEMALALELFNPANWLKLASPYYSRIDMAAEYYDNEIFEHKTFGDLAARQDRPFIILNATDMSFVGRFEFTQDQFDLLGSDLSSYPVARGVAASSAFPILLTPLTLHNYPKTPDNLRPQWIDDATGDRPANPKYYANALQNSSYLNTANRPFVHLMDGGLADNIGLRGPSLALGGASTLWTLGRKLDHKKYLVVITVNARAGGTANKLDKDEQAPGLSSVLATVTGGPMDNFSADTIQEIQDYLHNMKQDYDTSVALHGYDSHRLVLDVPPNVYSIELAFEDVADPQLRARLNEIPTNYSLSRDDVDELRRAAADLLSHSPGMQSLLSDIRKDSR